MRDDSTYHSQIELTPIAICLTLPHGGPGVVRLAASNPFREVEDDRLEVQVVSPSDCWLVRTRQSSWLLRMLDVEKGVFEVELTIELVNHLIKLGNPGYERLYPFPRLRSTGRPKMGQCRGLLASAPWGLMLIDLEGSPRDKTYVDCGQVFSPLWIKLASCPSSRFWVALISSDKLETFRVPFPKLINTTLSHAVLQASQSDEGADYFPRIADELDESAL